MNRRKPQPVYHAYDQIRITDHAAERFVCRSIENKLDVKTFNCENQLRNLVRMSRPIRVSKKFKAMAMINNKFALCEYRFCNGWIMIIKNNTLLTVYRGKLGVDFRWFHK